MVKLYDITPEPMRGYMRPLCKCLNRIKTFFLVGGLLFYLEGRALAQENTEPKPEGGPVEPLKIAYITRKLNLSTEEAQKFWPIYNDYMKEIRQTRLETKGGESEIATEEKILTIRKKYNEPILSLRKRVQQFRKKGMDGTEPAANAATATSATANATTAKASQEIDLDILPIHRLVLNKNPLMAIFEIGVFHRLATARSF
jgi:hypothetical protein